MEVRVVHNPARESVDIYVFRRVNQDQRMYHRMDEPPVILNAMEEAPVFGRFPVEVIEAIAREISPPTETDATERHLDDAVMIRDRLLTLVESEFKFRT